MTTTIPAKEEMLKRLLTVSTEPHFIERFYPILLQRAGGKLLPPGIVMMFTLAIDDYCEGMPDVMTSVMYAMVPQFIDALVDNLEARTQAKAFLQEVLAAK